MASFAHMCCILAFQKVVFPLCDNGQLGPQTNFNLMLQFYQDVKGELALHHFNSSSKLIFVMDTTKERGRSTQAILIFHDATLFGV